jgi:hypothetical protein
MVSEETAYKYRDLIYLAGSASAGQSLRLLALLFISLHSFVRL